MFRTSSLGAVASGVWLWLLCAGDARAYCRTTDASREGGCFESCVEEGVPLAWTHPTIRYVFNEDGFPGLDAASQRAIFAQAFQQWEDVTCAGESIGLTLEAERGSTSLRPRDFNDHSTVNVIGHLSAREWSESDHDPHAFAVTRVRFVPEAGVIVGADMWFNGGMGSFEACPEEGCPPGRQVVDLLNVTTHEAGHLLGLAHSLQAGSTMECSASPDDTDKRSLAQDDRDGLCAIYPPGLAFDGDYIGGKWAPLRRAERHASCSLHGAPSGGAAWSWLAPLAWLVLRRRRARG